VRTSEEFTAAIEKLDDPEVIARTGLELARQLLGFELAVYYLRRGDRLELVSYSGLEPPELQPLSQSIVQSLSVPGARGLSGKTVRLSHTVWENDYATCPEAIPALRDHGLKSVIFAPIVTAKGVEGTFGLAQFGSWRPITPSVRWVIEALVMRMAHALKERRAVEEVRRTLEGGLLGLGLALEHRDLETAGHTERVVGLAARLGEALGLSRTELEALRHGAYLHDIGKLAVPDAVLLKPGKLSAGEWATMRAHSAKGFEIAAQIPTLSRGALEVIRHHHERWDGLGYPDGLEGEAIPLVARIFAVCDVFDALTSARPYKRAWTEAQARDEIRAQAGRQFDPHVTEVFLTTLLEPQDETKHLPRRAAEPLGAESSL
jgi:putative nucleotidyltransferase with HDIG domain